MIADEQGENVLDLRIGKAPYCARNNEVFDIHELDEAYDYVKDSQEWFVDIYENNDDGRFRWAEFTGSALLSTQLDEEYEKLTNKRPRTAYEKFEARLMELGLWEDWCEQGCMGRVGAETENGISILVHEDEHDKYTEFTYPPMSKMQEDDDFRLKALAEFYPAMPSSEDKFLKELVYWVIGPNVNKCPLFPVDVYFIWDKAEWSDFEDDVEDDKEPEPADEKIEEYCPHCDQEVLLEPEFKAHKCPNCGKWIVACAQCPLENCTKTCPLERMADILNK